MLQLLCVCKGCEILEISGIAVAALGADAAGSGFVVAAAKLKITQPWYAVSVRLRFLPRRSWFENFALVNTQRSIFHHAS